LNREKGVYKQFCCSLWFFCPVTTQCFVWVAEKRCGNLNKRCTPLCVICC